MITSFLVGIEVGFKIIGEEEEFQYQEHNQQLDDDNGPQFPAYCHAFKAQVVKLKNITNHPHD